MSFYFSQDTTITSSKRPQPFDLKKGLNLDVQGLIPNFDNDSFSKPLSQLEIETIIENAKKWNVEPVTKDDIVIMETTMGHMKIKLFPDIAPLHAENFKRLANSGYYDGTTFHRIIPGFMIQGGDILSRDENDDNDGYGGPGWTVNAEFNDKSHQHGILSMARASDPNSAGSQFFICVADASHLDEKYTVFGEVVENVQVIDKIVTSATDYDMAKAYCKKKIPEGENLEKWIELQDIRIKGEVLYAKIPSNETRSSYTASMKKQLESNKPVMPIRMKKVRVVNKNTLNEKKIP